MSSRLDVVWLGSVPYRQAWTVQRRLAQARRRGEITGDCLLLLEHDPVYTMGRTGKAAHVPLGADSLVALGAEYVDVDRGGSVTFHGPGQLVAYPVVNVASRFPLAGSAGCGDVIRYVRALECAVIDTVSAYGVKANARPPFTGVWIDGSPAAKIAAIGVKVAGGVSTHGIALNVSTDLSWFEHIVACGIAGAGVTSLQSQGVVGATVRGVANTFAEALGQKLDRNAADASDHVVSLINEVMEDRPAAA